MAFSVNLTTSAPYTGYVYHLAPGATSATSLTLPTEVSAVPRKPAFDWYRGSLFIGASFSRVLRVEPNKQVFAVGIAPPTSAPTLAASGTGITGNAIAYLTFLHKDAAGRIIHESNPSPASSTLALTNQGRAWSGIPTIATDSRVTHVSGYVSMDGATPRRAWTRRLGDTSTVTEAIPTTTLANNTPVPVDVDGNVDDGARGVPPYSVAIKSFHDRMWYVDPSKPGVYFSKLYEPESVDPDSYIPTKEGEQPIGLGVLRDELVVFCERSVYVITGYGTADFRIEKVSSKNGAVSHQSIVEIDGMLFYASHDGIKVYLGGGQFRYPLARSRRTSYKTDYKNNRASYLKAVAIDDLDGNYRCLITYSSGTNRSYEWVVNYRTMTEEGQLDPLVTNDVRARTDDCIGVIAASDGTLLPVTGSSDGYIRQEDATDDDDDTDTYAKKVVIQTGGWVYKDQGGSLWQGCKWQRVDPCFVNPNDAVVGKFYAGDTDATSAASPQHTHTFPAMSDASYVKQGSHTAILASVAGKFLYQRYEITSPVGFEYLGSYAYGDTGVQSRAAK